VSDAPDFVSEAQDLVEAFSRALLDIDTQNRESGSFDPEVLNGAFRAIHTLKGLASLSGGGAIAELSHILENVLDDLRLGKLPLNAEALDLLFEIVEVYGRLLNQRADSGNAKIDTSAYLAKLQAFSRRDSAHEVVVDLSWIDQSLGTVLTEYEEHRLRENIKAGRNIYRVHASFPFLEIDVGIESLKAKLKSFGEVITYLPSADGSAEDRLDLDIVVGAKARSDELQNSIGRSDIRVEVMWTPSTPKEGTRVSEPTPSKPTVDMAPHKRASPASHDGSREPHGAANARGAGSSPPPAANAEISEVELGADAELSLKSVSQTVRVDLRRLDGLMNSVGELGVVLANFTDVYEQMNQVDVSPDIMRMFRDELRTMERRLNALREGILAVRMVPLGQVFDKLARVVRKIGRECGKEVRLGISGQDTELDKLIVEELSDPLMHMIRNSIDHGIEMPDEREAMGKPRVGHIDLRAYQKGNRVVIEVVDDGRGMDWRSIRDIAVSRGFLSREEAEDLSARQCINLIFSAGFSTREKATELSGRGVGMDVVKTNITRLSGTIDVISEPNRGSCFAVTLPVTLALIQALVIECGGETFCIPLNSVIETFELLADRIHTIEGHPVLRLRGRTLPLVRVADVLELTRPHRRDSEMAYVVVVGVAQHRIGLVVDDLLGQHNIMMKPLGHALNGVPGIAGATELGASRTVLLLDVAKLVTEAVDGYGSHARNITDYAS
jgi:two-component system chemotaxis sensor kinase CheA